MILIKADVAHFSEYIIPDESMRRPDTKPHGNNSQFIHQNRLYNQHNRSITSMTGLKITRVSILSILTTILVIAIWSPSTGFSSNIISSNK